MTKTAPTHALLLAACLALPFGLSGSAAEAREGGTPPGELGRGAGEVHLDAGAVQALVTAATPPERALALPGLPTRVTLRWEAPRQVRLGEGAIAADVGLTLVEAGVSGRVALRLVPELRERDGVVLLRVTRALGQGPLAVFGDFAAVLPPFELPRRAVWPVPQTSVGPLELGADLHGLAVEGERLVIRFGVWTRRDAPAAAPNGEGGSGPAR